MGYQQWGGATTAAANQVLYWKLEFNGSYFGGPIAVAPDFEGGDENFGILTVGNMSVEAVEGNPAEPGAYYPATITYHCTITNESAWPLSYSASVGTF
jgi:hypothetical protein